MIHRIMKRALAMMLAAVIIFSLTACGSSGKKTREEEKTAEFTGEEMETTESGLPPAVAAEVDLPEDMKTMAFPIWALLVSAALDRQPYYGFEENATDENADAFFGPMSVLSTLIEEKTDYGQGQETEDGYYKITEGAFASYATALFDSYGMQEIEAPEIEEENPYAQILDDEDYPYAFAKADLDDFQAAITGCTADADNYRYEITAELRDMEQKGVLFEASFSMIPSSFEGEEEYEIFNYSITGISDETDYSYEEEGEENTEDSGKEKILEDNTSKGKTGTEEGTTSSPDSEEVDNPDVLPSDSDSGITKDQADNKAQEYSGKSDLEYQGQENLDGQDYYNYTYEDEDGESHNVLVPSDGSDPIGGKDNGDGTWTFDE